MLCKTCKKDMGDYCGKRKFCSNACKQKSYREKKDEQRGREHD